jgi:alcohol dehydrogenase class IV
MDERGAAGAAVVEMGAFLRRIGHPLRLSEAGVKEEDLVKAAGLSLSDGAIVNNPRMVLDEEEVLAVYRAAF